MSKSQTANTWKTDKWLETMCNLINKEINTKMKAAFQS